MLLKLDALSEIGRFATLRHKAPQFSRLTLIFARNAFGKSTICGLLNSASTGKASMVAARRRLGATQPTTAQFDWASTVVSFAGGKWNAQPGPLHILDQEYVETNVHVAGSVTRANKRELLGVVIGRQGVELAAKIEAADADLKDVAARQAASERTIKAAHPAVTNVQAYCDTPVPDDIDGQLARSGRAVELARRASSVSQRRSPERLAVQTPAFYEAILAASVTGISQRAAEMVSAHIASHSMQPNGQRWVQYGLEHTVGSACPFCGQETGHVELVTAYQGYFSEAFAEHVRAVEAAQQQLHVVLGENGEGLVRRLESIETDFQFWCEVAELPSPPALSGEFREQISVGLAALDAILSQKLATPLAVLGFEGGQIEIVNALALLASANDVIAKSEPLIAEARTEAARADLGRAEQVLAKLQALYAKSVEPMKTETKSYCTLSATKIELTESKAVLQKQLRDYVSTTISARQGEINGLLRQFGTNFEIGDTKASFVGREPNADYSVLVDRHVVKAGEEVPGTPSFKTVLSAGDKFTLALAFFLSHVRADPRLADSVVVFDDPFSSQDMQRQFETASQIRTLAGLGGARQVIVLSHDPRFLHLIQKDADAAVCSAFQISFEDDRTGAIKAWSAEEELKTAYVRQSERIRAFAGSGQYLSGGNAESLVKEIRPFTEEFIKLRFPGRFTRLVMLDAMIIDIEQTGSSDPLFKDVANLRTLNEYTRSYMHGGGDVPDAGQLRAQCGRVLDIIGRY